MKRKIVSTPFGRLNTDNIIEYGLAEEFFPQHSEDDIFILIKTPKENVEKYGHRMYVIIHNFVPEDYNVYEKDQWSYGGLRSEGHYTTTEIDEDFTRQEYISENIDELDIVYALQYLNQSEYTILATNVIN